MHENVEQRQYDFVYSTTLVIGREGGDDDDDDGDYDYAPAAWNLTISSLYQQLEGWQDKY